MIWEETLGRLQAALWNFLPPYEQPRPANFEAAGETSQPPRQKAANARSATNTLT